MNKKTLIIVVIIIIALSVGLYFLSSSLNKRVAVDEPVVETPATSITYKNTTYGFDFTLPTNWQGYSIIENTWKGTPLSNTQTQSGPKLLIRNPKWTATAPYEDLPILVFTIPQWNSYLKEDFNVSAAPIQATELARNNVYVFALPPRWDFDYSLNFKEAQNIFATKPLHAFNIEKAIDTNKMTLGMKTWNWVNTGYSDDTTITPKTNKFAITFKADKTFSATTDCNGVGGEYVVNGNNITLTKMMSTQMYCEGSQEQAYSKMLGQVQSYMFTSKGELVLILKLDTGSMIFK